MRIIQLLVVIFFLCVGLMAADSPFSGTWKYNPAKSHSIKPAQKSSTAHIEVDDQTFKLNQDFVDDKGQTSGEFEAKFDSKDYPMKGDPNIDSVSVRRVNEHEILLTFKKAGKVVYTNDGSVSRDGKTSTWRVTDLSEGHPKKGIDVYDKQ